jgi:cytochrome oxidase Cu insertion factor (SCO1/SenC/PrrC family)
VRRGALTPWLVALAVFGPFAAAVLLYYVPADSNWLPRLPGSRELLEPPLAAPPAWLDSESGAAGARFRWSLIYAKMAACDRPCYATLERLRQVHTALAGDAERVQRVFWHAGEAPGIPGDPDLVLRRVDEAPVESVVRALGAERLEAGRVYVADPRGLIVVSYPADVAQKELLRDLKRLLSASGSNR